jgi:hypothetical protein
MLALEGQYLKQVDNRVLQASELVEGDAHDVLQDSLLS